MPDKRLKNLDGYNTIEDAAAAAQFVVRKDPDHKRHEFASVIYQDPETGKFKFTKPESQRDNAGFRITATIPKDSLRGIFHNHPKAGDFQDLRQFFSEDDVEISKQLGVKSFIDLDNELLSFDPKDGRTKRIRVGGEMVRAGIGVPTLAKIPLNLLGQKRGVTGALMDSLQEQPTGNPIAAGNEMSRKRAERP